MKRFPAFWLALSLAASLLVAGCTQAAPEPTKAPAAPPKAAEPTKAAAPTAAPAAAPTRAPEPAKKVNFPEKGKTITAIVGWPAGGGADTPTRILAPFMEKDLGVQIQVVNKAGATGQVGLTELVRSKPDGYTFCYTGLPDTPNVYLDPERQAAFGRKDFQPLGLMAYDPGVVAVGKNSPYKTLKDLLDAAKANPKGIKLGTNGLMSEDHLSALEFQQIAGVQFSFVHFDGAAPANTAMAGGHVDLRVSKVGTLFPLIKPGEFRALAVLDKERSRFVPDVPTAESLGYKHYWHSWRGFSLPTGTPKEIEGILTASLKKAVESDEFVTKMGETGQIAKYLTPEEFSAAWDDLEKRVKPLIDLAKKDK